MYNDDSKLVVFHYKFSNNTDIKIGCILKSKPSNLLLEFVESLQLHTCFNSLPKVYAVVKEYERLESCHLKSWQRVFYQNFTCNGNGTTYDIIVENPVVY